MFTHNFMRLQRAGLSLQEEAIPANATFLERFAELEHKISTRNIDTKS